MRRIRYLIDENTTCVLVDQLLRLRPDMDILLVGDDIAPPLGTLDPDILLWLEQEDRCLITKNRASMPQHLHDHLAAGHHIPGILTLKPKASLHQIIEDLLLIWDVCEPDEYRDRIEYLPF